MQDEEPDDEGAEALHVSIHELGVREDEPVVSTYDDMNEKSKISGHVSKMGESFRQTSPALSAGIPVTTPRYSPSPIRPRAVERFYKEEGDDFSVVDLETSQRMHAEREAEATRVEQEDEEGDPEQQAIEEAAARAKAQEDALLALPIVQRGSPEAKKIAIEAILEVGRSQRAAEEQEKGGEDCPYCEKDICKKHKRKT